MKNITLIAAMAVSTFAMAQREVGPAIHQADRGIHFSAERGPIDTLVPSSFGATDVSLALYYAGTTPANGFIAGTNTYGDKAKVQVFNSTGTVHVEQLLFLFGAKNVNGTPNAMVHARVYGLNGPGTATSGTVSTAPGTVLGNVDIPISQCDTAGLTVAMFSPSITLNGNFGGGFDVSDLATGTLLGVISTENNAITPDDQNWEKTSDDSWVAMSDTTVSWGIHFDMAIFAVLDDGFAGINDVGSFNNMRMSFISGNPATSNVTVAYEMLESASVRLVVMDRKGAKVVDQQLGNTTQGEHQSTLDVSNLANGIYYVTLFANGNPLTKKLVVQH